MGVDRDADSCSFYVRDNGKGIPVDVQRRIFEPFREGLSRHPGGIGMGLALVEAIVSDAGGEVWVESAAGAGATFCFTLPSVE